MKILVTRPEREAQGWVAALRQAGHEAEALPLIEIAPVQGLEVQALQQAWLKLSSIKALMFVSANAVEGFFAARPASCSSLPDVQAWATGPGTVKALMQAGWPGKRIVVPASDAPQFDSEALWDLVKLQIQPGMRVLIVRGGSDGQGLEQSVGVGRDWFAQQAQTAGATVEFLVSYQRRKPQWSGEQRQRAVAAASDGSVWLFSSSEAVRHLQGLGGNWNRAKALATHARIAQAAHEAGFGFVGISRPALPDVLAALASIK